MMNYFFEADEVIEYDEYLRRYWKEEDQTITIDIKSEVNLSFQNKLKYKQSDLRR